MNTNLYKQNKTIIIMGLDCIVKIHNGSEYTSDLPLEIVDQFKQICNADMLHIGLYESKYYISFCGKAYCSIILKLTGHSLYRDLNPPELKLMYDRLNGLLENFKYMEEYNNDYQNWLDMMTGTYIPSPAELIELKDTFKICYENNLQLYACY